MSRTRQSGNGSAGTSISARWPNGRSGKSTEDGSLDGTSSPRLKDRGGSTSSPRFRRSLSDRAEARTSPTILTWPRRSSSSSPQGKARACALRPRSSCTRCAGGRSSGGRWPRRGRLGPGRSWSSKSPDRPLEATLTGQVTVAVQEEPRGTADAVKAAAGQIDPNDTVIVLNGDHPLITTETLAGLVEAHRHSGAVATLATAVLEDPSGYGRVIRAPDGTVEKVVETKGARRCHGGRAAHPEDQHRHLRVRGRGATGRARRGP